MKNPPLEATGLEFMRSGAVVIDANIVDEEIARGRRACAIGDFQVQVEETNRGDVGRNRGGIGWGDDDCLR